MTANKSYREVLNQMIDQPGMISEAYSQFHNYSFGNVMMVLFQCALMGKKFGPVSNYKNWQRLGRQVRKGEKAMIILHPVERKFTKTEIDENGEEVEKEVRYMTFVEKATAFVLSQTDGEDIEWTQYKWNKDQALAELGIEEIEFDSGNGNSQGFANMKGIAVNPVAAHPLKTMVHEIAHKMLHITEGMTIVDLMKMDYSENEVEAETIAMIVAEALGMSGREESIGYIRGWMRAGFEYTDKMANRILSTANKILRAGQVEIEVEQVIEEIDLISSIEAHIAELEGELNHANDNDLMDQVQAIMDRLDQAYAELGKAKMEADANGR